MARESATGPAKSNFRKIWFILERFMVRSEGASIPFNIKSLAGPAKRKVPFRPKSAFQRGAHNAQPHPRRRAHQVSFKLAVPLVNKIRLCAFMRIILFWANREPKW